MGIIKKFQYNSPVVLTFTILSFLALLLSRATGGMSNIYVFSVYRSPFADPLTYVRIFTHVMGHAGFEHFFNNFLIILLVGPMLEEKYGSKRLAVLMLVTALFTGALHVAMYDTALLGASGIVFFMILLAGYTNFEKGRIPITLILIIFIFIGREISNMLLLDDNVSRLTHIFGGAVGAFGGYVYNRYLPRYTA